MSKYGKKYLRAVSVLDRLIRWNDNGTNTHIPLDMDDAKFILKFIENEQEKIFKLQDAVKALKKALRK